jgi:hypothetical protein
MTTDETLRQLAETATPGPWRWGGSITDPKLWTVYGGHVFVMGFERCGMQGAQPTFQVYHNQPHDGTGIMELASKLAVREVPYRDDIVDIANQDARWIAAADPTTILALLSDKARLTARVAELEAALSVERIAEANHRNGVGCRGRCGPEATHHVFQALGVHAALLGTSEPTKETE